MKRPDDETLMAYADGALDREESREVERCLEIDAEARRIVEAFKRTRTLTHAAFDGPAHEESPKHLIDAIMNAPRGDATPIAKHLISKDWRSASWTALAASVALIAGLGLGVLLAGANRSGTAGAIALGPLPRTDPISVALTELTSAATATISRQSLTVLTTFRDALQRPCREFELSAAEAEGAQMVAVSCRDGGEWRIDAAVRIPPAQPDGNGGFAPAGSERTDALAGILTLLGAGAALTPDQEAALIARNWEGRPRE